MWGGFLNDITIIRTYLSVNVIHILFQFHSGRHFPLPSPSSPSSSTRRAQSTSSIPDSSRCKLHQHFTHVFFVRNCFFCQNITRENLQEAPGTKNASVKCWWKWLQVRFDVRLTLLWTIQIINDTFLAFPCLPSNKWHFIWENVSLIGKPTLLVHCLY